MNPEDFSKLYLNDAEYFSYQSQLIDEIGKVAGLQKPQPAVSNPQFIRNQFISGPNGAYRNRTAEEIFASGQMTDEEYRLLSQGQKDKLNDLFVTGNRPQFNSRAKTWSWTPPQKREPTMLETIIRLYTCYMEQDVRSPIPHLAGPPGTNKSSVMKEFAEMIGVRLHVWNVARFSPLELEGLQMPVGTATDESYRLKLLHSPLWTSLREGDIVLLDEFLRGFPEVYNGLLDIMTSREVAGFTLPKVFFIAASNSIATYDKALEDRLLHIKVPDIRKSSAAMMRTKQVLADELGLHPKSVSSQEMSDLIANEVVPMYGVLDQFDGKAKVGTTATDGHSVRNLIGQAKLREVQSVWLKELIQINNTHAMQDGKPQFVLLLDGKKPPIGYVPKARQLQGNPKLTPIQAANLSLNLQLVEMEEAKRETTTEERELIDDSVFD